MFFREKTSGPRSYLQLVENAWENGKTKQRVVATLGRLDHLQESGELDRLLESGAKYSEKALLLVAHEKGELDKCETRRIGPALVFERLWQETGIQDVLGKHLAGRGFEFSLERAIFLTVLYRLLRTGPMKRSDRACERWRRDYGLTGTADLKLHQIYRAMAWLGEELPESEQDPKNSLASRCVKDLIEEDLFARRRDLFSTLEILFFDTTSMYFEGSGGETIGRYGHSKDNRPDRRQMVVGAVLDGAGYPVCCELWPGNTTDVKTLIPVLDRMKRRFVTGRVCIVADRGMFSKENLAYLESTSGADYILGAKMRKWKEVRDAVVESEGPFEIVHPKGSSSKDPSPLQVRVVEVGGHRYILCYNEDQAKKDAADRIAILASLRKAMKAGELSMVGNKGYRRYLKKGKEPYTIDEGKVRADERYDGRWVLRTSMSLPAAEVALRYKDLWMVEQVFRSSKSVLDTRPIFHQRDDTIRGHVFCTFLALILIKTLRERLAAKGEVPEWGHLVQDLESLDETEVHKDGKRYLIRSDLKGVCGKVFQAVGVAIPPSVRRLP